MYKIIWLMKSKVFHLSNFEILEFSVAFWSIEIFRKNFPVVLEVLFVLNCGSVFEYIIVCIYIKFPSCPKVLFISYTLVCLF